MLTRQAMERDERGRKVRYHRMRGKLKRRPPKYFRIVRPVTGFSTRDMSWAVSVFPVQTHGSGCDVSDAEGRLSCIVCREHSRVFLRDGPCTGLSSWHGKIHHNELDQAALI
jgi:hypothetical protein